MRMRCALIALLMGVANSAAAQVNPEDAIHYRQSQFSVILWNWMPLNGMVRGRIPFDAKEFAKRAERVASVAPQLLEGFPAGSDSGAETSAKKDIWADFADFTAKMKTFEQASAKLATTARAGDEAAIKAQFAVVGDACKACHDKYKAE